MRNAPGAEMMSRSWRRAAIVAVLGLSAGCQADGYRFASRAVDPAGGPGAVASASEAVRVAAASTTGQPPVSPVAYHDDAAFTDTSPIADTPPSLGEILAQEQVQSPSDSSAVDAPLVFDDASVVLDDGAVVVDDAAVVVETVSSGLTLDQIEAMALASHPAVAEARAQVNVARGQYVQAGLPFNPQLQYQSQEIGNEGASGLHSVSVYQQIVTANKLDLAQQVQSQEIQRESARLRVAQLQVLTRVRAAFAQTLVAQQRAALTNRIVQLAEKSVDSVEALVEAQEVSRVALLQSRVEAEQARITAENAQTRYLASRRTLAASAGISPRSIGALAGEISEQGKLPETPWESLIEEISRTSPEIAAAGSELQRARWALQLACAQVTPNVTGQLGVGYDAGTDDTFAVVGVTVPLPIRNRNQGNIRSARAEIQAAAAAIERTQLSLDRRLAAAVGRYQVARQRYERLQESVIPDAEETFELSQRAFEAGETDYLQLLTAQRTLFNTRLTMLDALSDAKTALAEIEGLLVTLDE